MITQNWNTRTGEELITEKPDEGQQILVNGDTFTKRYNQHKIKLNGFEIPRKMVGNIIAICSHKQILGGKNLPKYLYVKNDKVIGISKEIIQ
jgi:hypothetical protein